MDFINPTEWMPERIEDLIGEAQRVGRIVIGKVKRLKPTSGALKQLFYGAPGTGKTALAQIVIRQLTGHSVQLIARGHLYDVQRKAGQDVTIDIVREWERDLGFTQLELFDGWRVVFVNELDLMPPAAQSRLLEYLDRLPRRCAFIGTTNAEIDSLQERFQTRLAPWKIEAPTTEQIIAFLGHRWPMLPAAEAHAIAVGCAGNVRAACLDAESALDVQMAA